MNRSILSPQEYKKFIYLAYGKKFPTAVIDLWCVPDYWVLARQAENLGIMDFEFCDYAKGEKTQHQFIVEATDDIENFPCGVKTTYRKYSASEVIEIFADETSEVF